MDRLIKKCFSVILSIVLLLTMLPLSDVMQVYAAENEMNADVYAVEGLSDMGKLLAQNAEQEQETPVEEYPGGYSLLDLKVSKKVATVEYVAPEDATIIVVLYSEDNPKMIASGNAPVSAEETTVQVSLTGSVPKYFRAAAYLVRTADLAPMCDSLETSLYTENMQKLLKSTVSSYPKDRVINLDDDKTTNFMVLQEGVVKVTTTETANRFVSIDREKKYYVIENADASVSGLQPGDIFVHNDPAGEWIVAKVEEISVDGTTVTIQGADPKSEEVFSHVKIETTGTTEQIEFDQSTLDENVTYLGTSGSEQENGTPVTRGVTRDLTVEDKETLDIPLLKFGISVEGEVTVGDNNLETKFEAEVVAELGVQLEFTYYQVNDEVLTDYTVKGLLSLTGEFKGEVKGQTSKLGDWTWKPIPGLISVGFEPRVAIELSGGVELSCHAGFATKLYYDRKADCYRSTVPAPDVGTESKVEGELFIGIDFNPTVEVLGGLLLDADVSALVGLFFTGNLTGTKHGDVAEVPEGEDVEIPKELHSCEVCIDGEVHAGAKLGLEIKIAGLDILKNKEVALFWARKIGDFYCCSGIPCGHFPVTIKGGICPQRRFLITVEALDEQGNPISNGVVIAQSSKQGQSAVEIGTTNSNGVVSNYLAAGKYTFCVKDSNQKTHEIEINGAGKVRIDGQYAYFAPTNPGSALSPILEKIVDGGVEVASGKCGETVEWTLSSSGYLKIQGTGAVTENPWTEEPYDLRVVAIDEGITDIAERIFYYETDLISVSLPNTLKTIGDGAFYYTDVEILTLPEGLTEIGDNAFYGCSDLTSVNLPNSLQTIGESAFYGCRSLKGVILPRGLTQVADSTFSGCKSLSSASIPNTVTVIGDSAFRGCEALTSIKIHETVTSIGNSAFYGSALYSVVLHDTLTELGGSAFARCENLQSIQLPSTLTEIPDYLLSGCSSLTSVTIPQPVTKIGSNAFEECTSLTSVVIPGNVTEIGSSAFAECTELTTVVLPNGLKTLEDKVFSRCTNLADISLPNTVTEIGGGVFEYCESLTSMTLPEGITKVSHMLFYGCIHLTSVGLPSTVTEIGGLAFARCGFVSIEIPDHITVLEYNAFQECTNLQTIVLPGTITEIPMYCFDGCTSLTQVTMPDTVERLNTAAFQGCTSLKRIELPEKVTHIAGFVFNECSSLEEVNIPEQVNYIGEAAFQNCVSLKTITLPGVITEIYNHTFFDSGLTSIRIPKGVTSIGYAAFANCEHLKKIELPDTLEYLDSAIFYECTALKQVAIPEGVSEIPSRCFYECTSLETVDIPDSVQEFGGDSFYGCANLIDIYIPDGTTSIGGFAFFGCDSLGSVNFPASLTFLGSWSFAYCENLGSASFAGDAPSGSGWFLGNKMTVYYPEGNDTWTDDVKASAEWIGFIKELVWIPYTPTTTASDTVATAAVDVVDEQTQEEPKPAEVEDEQADSAVSFDEGDAPTHNSAIGGEYSQEEIDGKTVKTAHFADLTPGQSYLLLAVANVETEELLAPDNLLYVTQVMAEEDGTVTHSYIQRINTDISFVMLCGASNHSLKDATITFPAMGASAQEQAVDPIVEYNGKRLKEGVDYRIEGDVSYTKAGTYTCTIRGIYNYTGKVTCTYTVVDTLEHTYGYTDNGDGTHTVACSNCGDTKVEDHIYDETGACVCGHQLLKFAGMTLETGNSLGVNLVMKWNELPESCYAVITLAGKETVVWKSEKDHNGPYWRIPFAEINATQMMDQIQVVVYDADGKQISQVYTRTIEDYCLKQIRSASSSDKLKTLLVDMLNYGAAAQKFFAYNEENPANMHLTEEELALATQEITMVNDRVQGQNNIGSSLALRSNLELKFYYTNVSQASYAMVSYTNYAGEKVSYKAEITVNGSHYIVTVNTLLMPDCSSLVTCELYDADGNVLDGTKSVDSAVSYCARQTKDTYLYEAVVKFATSAAKLFG